MTRAKTRSNRYTGLRAGPGRAVNGCMNEMTKWTAVDESGGTSGARIYVETDNGRFRVNSVRDARLMAASPRLVAALRGLLERGHTTAHQTAVDEAEAALVEAGK